VVDWHNVRIGHMQHPARDPGRDHEHGRIYRITYPSRPLVKPAQVAEASVPALFENLKLPEYRTRYRSRRELRGRKPKEVLTALSKWVESLDPNDPKYEHHMLEGLWVSWGLNQVDESLLRKLLAAKDHRARSAAVRVLRYTGHLVEDQAGLLLASAGDDHGRVRMEVIAAASWLDREEALPIVEAAGKSPIDDWLQPVHEAAVKSVKGMAIASGKKTEIKTHLTGADKELFIKGAEVFGRDGHCGTCHQPDGQGLPAAQFPPLAGSEWVTGSEDRLIKLSLKGLTGPIEVKGAHYPGVVPMMPFHFLNDEELAGVLTYVRNSFGNKSTPVSPERVKAIREAEKDKTGFYSPADLLKMHPK
jgi:mono/diheme cytochrome c family protein